MPPRRQRIGWEHRPVSRENPRQLSLPVGWQANLSVPDVRFLVEQIKKGIGEYHGSTAMERMATNWSPNRGGTGLFDVMDAPAFHDLDPRMNPAGLPDVLAIVGKTLTLTEFKHRRDRPTERQQLWLDRLARVTHVWSGVVYPKDWAEWCELMYQLWLVDRLDQTTAVDVLRTPDPEEGGEARG